MVITIWKDINTLQVFSNIITKGIGQVNRRNGRDFITVKFPKCIITYQQHMVRVHFGSQKGLMGAVFENVSHL